MIDLRMYLERCLSSKLLFFSLWCLYIPNSNKESDGVRDCAVLSLTVLFQFATSAVVYATALAFQ